MKLFLSLLRANAFKIVSLVSLLIALNDAALLLGMHSGRTSPLALLGLVGFSLLGIFTILRLFASVGLWIGASWGAALLAVTTALEVGALGTGLSTAPYSAPGTLLRVSLALIVLGLLAHKWWQSRDAVHD